MPGKQKQPRVTRKEKKAQIASLVQVANTSKDVMSEFENLTQYHFENTDLKIEYKTAKMLNQDEMDKIFVLLQHNMQDLYEKSAWGWDEKIKKDELFEENARYLMAKNNDEKIIGFTHFRFDVEANHPVLYCYELHIEEEFQRKGLGKYLMNLLLLIASKFKLVKVMLTVFTHNEPALDFFMKGLGFRRDETCPYEEEDKCYVILSKCIDKSLINDIKIKMHK